MDTDHGNFSTSLNNTDTSYSYETEAVVSQIFAYILAVASLYFAVSFAVYEYRVVAKNKKIRVGRMVRKDNVQNLMSRLCLSASAILSLKTNLNLIEIEHQTSPPVYVCTVIRDVKYGVYSASVTLAYSVLWMRQKKFYTSECMKHLTNELLRWLSKYSIVIMITSVVGGFVLIISTRNYIGSTSGCKLHTTTIPSNFPGILIFVLTLIYQLLLLFLTVFPLVKHRNITSSFNIKQKRKMTEVKRCCKSTTATIVWSGISGIMALNALEAHNMWLQLIYDLDALMLLLSVVACFKDYRFRICSWIVKEENVRPSVRRREQDSNEGTEASNL